MLRSGLASLKGRVGKLLDSSPRVSFFTYSILVRSPWLLPHDRSYMGMPIIEAALRKAGKKTAGDSTPLILDIGANNGISSRGFLKLLPGWQVFAVEANSLHTEKLNYLLNKFPNRYKYVISAAGNPAPSQKSSITLYTPIWKGLALHTVTSTRRENSLKTAIDTWKLDEKEIEVVETTAPLISIDELNLNPSIVKIDAEGSEELILKGMIQTLRRSRPAVLMEITSQGSENAIQLMNDLKYQAFRLDEKTNRLVASDAVATENITGHRNCYFLPRELVEFLPQ